MNDQAPFMQSAHSAAPSRGLEGDVLVAVPLAWQAIGSFLFAILLISLGFLASAPYARVETVSGTVVLDRGVAPILPSRRGTVIQVTVRNGQVVRKGDPLATIRSEDETRFGATSASRILEAVNLQDRQLAAESELVVAAGREGEARLRAQIGGLQAELGSLDAQIAAQRRLVDVAASDFHDSREVADKGFISRRDLNQRESTLVLRQQQMAQLDQARKAKAAELAQARRTIAEAAATARSEVTRLQGSRSQLAQRVAEIEGGRGYVVTAPVSGTVTAITARAGQPALDQQPLMILVPAGARARAELYVPTRAAGFLAEGQKVRLAIDAFPYDRFGTVSARISEIATVATARPGPDGSTMPFYLTTVELERPEVSAFGRPQPLLPGMTLTGRIETRRQNLLHWLFEPFFAVSRR